MLDLTLMDRIRITVHRFTPMPISKALRHRVRRFGDRNRNLTGVAEWGGKLGVARHVYAPLPPQGNNRKQVSSRVCKSFSSCPKEAGPMVGGSPVGVFHDSALQERSSKQPAASPARITIAAIRSAGSWPPRVFLQWVNFVKLQNHARGPSLCRQSGALTFT